jgi:hypothetical protein
VRTVFEEFNGVLFSVHFVFSPWMGIDRHALIAKLKIFCSYTLMFRMLRTPEWPCSEEAGEEEQEEATRCREIC